MPGIATVNNIPPEEVARVVTKLENKNFAVEVIKQEDGNYTVKAAPKRELRIKLSVV